jgi:hypothetical protein
MDCSRDVMGLVEVSTGEHRGFVGLGVDTGLSSGSRIQPVFPRPAAAKYCPKSCVVVSFVIIGVYRRCKPKPTGSGLSIMWKGFLEFLLDSLTIRCLAVKSAIGMEFFNCSEIKKTAQKKWTHVQVGNMLDKAAALSINLTIDGAPIALRAHTHPSHSQTSRLFSL